MKLERYTWQKSVNVALIGWLNELCNQDTSHKQ